MIYWMRTAEVYPASGWHRKAFMGFDPEVRFPRFHMVEGDETIGNVHLIEGGPQSGQWQWSMTVALPGPRYGRPTNGVEESRGAASRRVVGVYRHYLSTRPEQYPRSRASRKSRGG
jgi:hypothetical protein